MNTLSWFIYFADIVENFSVFLYTFGWLSLIVFASVCTLLPGKNGKSMFPFNGLMDGKRPPYGFGVLGIGLIFLAALIPGTQTIYLIAGSEAGEMVVTSETGKEILSDIQDVIKHQLDTLKTSELGELE